MAKAKRRVASRKKSSKRGKAAPSLRTLRLKTWDVEGPLDFMCRPFPCGAWLHKLDFPGGGYAREGNAAVWGRRSGE